MGQIVFQATLGGQTALVGQNTASSYSLTLPLATDTLVGKATTDTLTNKTLTAPVISSIVNTGTLTLPTSTDTLVGRATTDTLTNKTLTSPTITGATLTTSAFNGTIGATTPSTAVVTSLTDSGLTSGRVTYATTGGLLTDSANLTYDGTNLMIGGTTTASATGYTFVNALGSNGGSFEVYSSTTRQAQFFCDSGSAYIGSVASIPLIFKTANAEKMRIDSSGNLLVGTTSTNNGAKFSVTADASATQVLGLRDSATTYANNDNYILFSNSAGSTAGGITHPASTSLGLWGVTDLRFIYGSGSTEAMRIDSSGNVGIGTSSPNASAILDAQSTTKGVRMPNMTTTQKNAISSPAAGLIVFDTTLAKLCVYSGSAWQTITSI